MLRRLVVTLMVTMILGLVVLIGLIVIRFRAPQQAITLPEAITLAGSGTAVAVTQGMGWYAVVVLDGDAERIEIYTRDGDLRQSVPITPSVAPAAP
ncbi:hypothetical protein AQS8620_01282 [Aquimixticola soesokkakensis]|uniref:Uncharacterized protein n=2 Tax=Aquimixticola soesokkakensis TaxID=1519096 RepID=A0A1Y5SA57_9RHOB|nr:hypothetical protein AQS8620_01282 [Aquimixticola soesokkakensis]